MKNSRTAMNILIDIRPLMDERYSGVAEYTLELLRALLAIDRDNRYYLWYNSARDISGRMPVFDYENVTVIRTRFPNKLLNYPLLWLLRRPRLDKLIGKKIDIFFMPHLNFFAMSPSVKTVITVHDISFHLFPKFFNWRKNLWHYFIGIKSLLRRFDRVVTMSENNAADIATLPHLSSKKIIVIPAGLPKGFRKLEATDPGLEMVAKKYDLPKRFVFFLGTIEPRKNIAGLLEAFERLIAETNDPDLYLILAGGRGWKAGPIYQRARRSSCNDRIRFIDYIDREDKVYLYNLAALFAYPSFYEGFGFPPLEAMACGTPTVTAFSASLPEVTENAALLVDPYNPSAIAEAMKAVLEDPALAESLSGAGMSQAEKFNWDRVAHEYINVFAELYDTV